MRAVANHAGIFLLSLMGGLLLFSGCVHKPLQNKQLSEQNRIASQPAPTRWQAWLTEPERLQPRSARINERVAVLIIRSARDWDELHRAAPAIGDCPDLHAGLVAGLVCSAGTPLEGGWPLRLWTEPDGVGQARLVADWTPGTYFADGATCVLLLQLPGVQTIAGVELDHVLYERPDTH